MTPAMRGILMMGVLGAATMAAWAQPSSVVFSKHNLSASGPGSVRAASEDQVCIFCHAPHNATPVQPLWNRAMSTSSYLVYASRALDAVPGQPTGTSKMCLSCHDGTIALGAVNSQPTPITMVGGVARMPPGHSNIGTDLRDDHPISFRFDTALSSRDLKLRNPNGLPAALKLDANSELQCTTCHDAHNDSRGKFLTMENAASQMCVSCHNVGTTAVPDHRNCNACHQPHTAPSGPYLLRAQTITGTCLLCHNGSMATAHNVAPDLAKAYLHDTASPVDPPDPQINHTTCTSCHDPHTMGAGRGVAPNIHPNFGLIGGISAAGTVIQTANSEYETCYKCHADGARIVPIVARKITSNNARLEFAPTAASFHPVQAAGRSTNVPSLKAPLTTSSMIYCSDCHSSDGSRMVGGGGPNGTHGSTHRGLLVERYDMIDNNSESAAAYALCYRCHDRSSILGDRSFRYHKKHIQDKRTPCIACHDAHGIPSNQGNTTNNAHLINFATNIVSPNAAGQLNYTSTGAFRGTCNLRCHGENHNNTNY